MANGPLFFLHVPRTGGTSLIEYFDRKMTGTRVCPANLTALIFTETISASIFPIEWRAQGV